MIFLSAQPASLYYAWQLEVQLNNFVEMHIQPKDIQVVCGIKKDIPQAFLNLQKKFTDVNFYFYEDLRIRTPYSSSIRAHILKQHWSKYPELSKEKVFFHDNDILFTKPVDWLDKFCDDDIWYGSETKSYTSYDYFQSKLEQVAFNHEEYSMDEILQTICEKIQVPFEKLKEFNKKGSIGAQYLMKNVTEFFWEKVEFDSEVIYKYFNSGFPGSVNHTFFPDENTGIQSFCADMFSFLWNAWGMGHKTQVAKEFDFAWSTDLLPVWEKKNIFHNAGITPGPEHDKHFRKFQYQNILPYNQDLSNIQNDACNMKYVEAVINSSKTTCLYESKSVGNHGDLRKTAIGNSLIQHVPVSKLQKRRDSYSQYRQQLSNRA